jgi:hypothetical protein
VSSLSQRGLRPIADLAVDREHGDRLKYLAGCRCLQCRAANSRYETERSAARKAGDWNGIVPAWRARRHILALSRKGVGRRALAEASDVGETCIQQIKNAQKTHIRKRTERKILAVTPEAISGAALISASRTQKLIGKLLHEGFTKADLARRLGYARPALQINRERITARNAMRVEKLFNQLMS